MAARRSCTHLKGFMFVNSDKAVGAGLRYRALNETIKDTLTWYQTAPREELKAGLSPTGKMLLVDGTKDITLITPSQAAAGVAFVGIGSPG